MNRQSVNYDLLLQQNPHPVLQLTESHEVVYANPAANMLRLRYFSPPLDKVTNAWLAEAKRRGSATRTFYAAPHHFQLIAFFDTKTGIYQVYGYPLADSRHILAYEQQLQKHLTGIVTQANSQCAIAILDIKEFKSLNTRYGYAIGDEILQRFHERLSRIVLPAFMRGRIASNEFILAVEWHETEENFLVALNSVMDVLEKSYIIQNHRIQLQVVVGVVFQPQKVVTAERLITKAQQALSQAHQQGLRMQVYCPNVAIKQRRLTVVREEFERAVMGGDWTVCYEPQIELASNQLQSVEALIRWHHPELGYIPPLEFIPIAEETGKIHYITRWMLAAVVKQLHAWQLQALPLIPIAVNISASELLDDRLYWAVRELAKDFYDYIQLELTESVSLQDIESSAKMLQRIKRLGIKISIDDFGAGYSGLNYLCQLSADKIKIDRSFIINLFKSTENQLIVNSILDLARRLHLRVCAEGIETIEQLEYLRQRGCHEGQGYYFTRGHADVLGIYAHKPITHDDTYCLGAT